MKSARFQGLADVSEKVYGHRHVIPVAVWIQEAGVASVNQPEVRVGLEGLSPPNKVLRALERLAEVGALQELPYLGRPGPRVFERVESAHWDAITAYAAEVDSKTSSPDDG